MNTENNKLIAVFMNDIESLDCEVSMNKACHVSELRYHNSWDELVPIIELCRERQYFGSQHLIDQIDAALYHLELNAVYEACVKFIKSYNEIGIVL